MSFPTSLFAPREIENKPGAVYNPDKKRVLFAEDINSITSEIIEIEKRLIPSENEPLSYGIKIGEPNSGFLFSKLTITDEEDPLFGSTIPVIRGLVDLIIAGEPESEPTLLPNTSIGLCIKRGIFLLPDPDSAISPDVELSFNDDNFPNSDMNATITLQLDESWGGAQGALAFSNDVGFIFDNTLRLFSVSGLAPHLLFANSITLESPLTGSLWRDSNRLYHQTSEGARELAYSEDISALPVAKKEYAFSDQSRGSIVGSTVMDNISSEFGIYRVTYYIRTDAPTFGSGTIKLNVLANDGINPNTQVTADCHLDDYDLVAGSFIVVKAEDQDITFWTQLTGSFGTATYNIIIIAEKLA